MSDRSPRIYNPCEEPDELQAPAKIWELMRRNDRFRNAVAELTELGKLDCETDSKVARDNARAARSDGFQMVRQLARQNPFAADALRWLVPKPLFIVEEVARISVKKESRIRVIRLGIGATPHPGSKRDTSWKWFNGAQIRGGDYIEANAKGWPTRWGPQITKTVARDRRLRHLRQDDIAEWRDYFLTKQRRFDLATSWAEAPRGFRECFVSTWTNMPGGCRRGEETMLLKDSNLGAVLLRQHHLLEEANRCIRDLAADLDRVLDGEPERVCPPLLTKKGRRIRQIPQFNEKIPDSAVAEIWMLNELNERRVFSVPIPRTKADAVSIFKSLGEQVASALPDHREIMGPPQFWADFVAVESIRVSEDVDDREAIRRHIRRTKGTERVRTEASGRVLADDLKNFFKRGFIVPRPVSTRHGLRAWINVRSIVNPILRKVDSTYRTDVKQRVSFMRDLIQSVFPLVDFDSLARIPDYKRRR